jgi:pyrroline-5-carboxylate reductase
MMVLFPQATPMTAHPIGFLGAGQMATALAKGWAAAGLLNAAKSAASDPHPAAREKFSAATGVRTVSSNAEVVQACEVVFLAVKPQTMSAVLSDVRPHLTPNHLVVSIAAGVTLTQLADALGTATRLVRVMPNTPALVGACAAGFAPSAAAKPEDVELVGKLFNAVGTAFAVPEHQLDAVTGLSGSGPAFVYVLIEALADGGVRVGLPREVALKLVAQTVFGSAKMVLETGTHPAVLKDAVASPGGTTIAGLHALERAGFRAAAMDAVDAAARRAAELAADARG